jgi:hypothetical protein
VSPHPQYRSIFPPPRGVNEPRSANQTFSKAQPKSLAGFLIFQVLGLRKFLLYSVCDFVKHKNL